ncbi:MAG: glycosyltransferase [Bacteroidales bacterium]|nr:glycosyltransferase [Bacteroidales bacterium]
MTELSIVIPTYKQKFLKNSLEGLAMQEDKDFEVVVVENGIPTDVTQNLCLDFRKTLKLRYIFEEIAGANRSRNIGTKNCNSEVIGLIDDDCIPDKEWTKRIKEYHYTYPDAGIIGGKVTLKFIEFKPEWLEGIFRSYLAELDWGKNDCDIEDYQYLVGANLSFKREVFISIGGFEEKAGLKYDNLLANDELDFITNTRKQGKKIIYSPKILVTHLIPQNRTSLRYLQRKSYSQGRADAILLRKTNPNFDINDAKSFLDTIILEDGLEISHINELKLNLRKSVFLEYFRNFIQSKLLYYKGFTEEIKSNESFYSDVVLRYSDMHNQYQQKIEKIKKIGGD